MADIQSRSRRSALIPVDSSPLSAEDTEDIQRRTCATPAPAEDPEQPLLKNPFSPTCALSPDVRPGRQHDDREIVFRGFQEHRDDSHLGVNKKTSDWKLWPAFRRRWRMRDGKRVLLLHQQKPLLRNSRLKGPFSEDTRPVYLTEDTAHPSGPLWPYYDQCPSCTGYHE